MATMRMARLTILKLLLSKFLILSLSIAYNSGNKRQTFF